MTRVRRRIEQIRGEPPPRDVFSKKAAPIQKRFFAVAALTTGGVLTVAWIGLLSWLLAHVVHVTFW